ncbi:VPXXXP-CTERM sorting domain-containing protein, partial [Methanohalophilus sp. RSK]|uniref:SdrD B-like domain-containing protein n=1 Tax=Methanohalophilus sp. RSK TaxID=2485783 RepID=UPI000F43B803
NLSSIDVQDNITGVTPAYLSGDTNDDGILEPGEVWMYNATGIAEEGQYANLGNVTGTPEVGDDVTDEDPSHYFGSAPLIDIEKSTNGDDADTPTGPTIDEGDPVNWEYVVTNIGNVNLTNINVTDNQGEVPVYQSGDTNIDGILEPGEIWTYTASGVAGVGQYSNIGNVTGEYNGLEVNDSDPSHYFGEEPPRSTLGNYVWEDLDRDGIQDETDTGIAGVTVNLYTGGEVFVTSTTTNETGYYLFTNLVAGDYFVEFVLPDDYEFSPADQGVDDTVDSDASVIDGRTVTTSLFAGEVDLTWDAGMYLPLSIDIEKSTNGQDADDPKGPTVEVGSTVEWEYVVTNTGSANLTNINVTDDQGVIPVFQGIDLNNDDILAPGEMWTYTANGTAEFGQYVNNATATGEYEGETVEDSDPSHYYGEEKDVPTAHPLLTVALIGMGIVLFLRRKEE